MARDRVNSITAWMVVGSGSGSGYFIRGDALLGLGYALGRTQLSGILLYCHNEVIFQIKA